LPIASKNSVKPQFASISGANLRRLLNDLQSGNEIDEQEFWELIEQSTNPFYEEIEDDMEKFSTTFIYKGDDLTQSVFVNLPPFSRLVPKDFQMSQIEGTSVWALRVNLPSASRFAYNFVVNSPSYKIQSESPKEEIAQFRSAAQIDSLNPNRLNDKLSYIETPHVEIQKFLEKRLKSETGKIERFVFKSEILANERTISVYTPSKYDENLEYPLLVLFDEEIYTDEIDATTVLDNLIREKLIPPIIAVFVGNAEGMRETELPCNPQFSKVVSSELLDWIKKSYKISEKATETIIGGASFGGLCAIYTGLSYPEIFGKILSQSGSFWRNYDAVISKIGEQNFRKQRIYLDAGMYEIEQRNGISLLDANRNLHERLTAKHYRVEYQEFSGGHGAINWRGTFADALIFLTKDLMETANLAGNSKMF
jgi:enterochelin esterase-like enzyme